MFYRPYNVTPAPAKTSKKPHITNIKMHFDHSCIMVMRSQGQTSHMVPESGETPCITGNSSAVGVGSFS